MKKEFVIRNQINANSKPKVKVKGYKNSEELLSAGKKMYVLKSQLRKLLHEKYEAYQPVF